MQAAPRERRDGAPPRVSSLKAINARGRVGFHASHRLRRRTSQDQGRGECCHCQRQRRVPALDFAHQSTDQRKCLGLGWRKRWDSIDLKCSMISDCYWDPWRAFEAAFVARFHSSSSAQMLTPHEGLWSNHPVSLPLSPALISVASAADEGPELHRRPRIVAAARITSLRDWLRSTRKPCQRAGQYD